MTLEQAHKRAARLSRKWIDGAYVVECGDLIEVWSFAAWHDYGFTPGETIAVYEGGERVA